MSTRRGTLWRAIGKTQRRWDELKLRAKDQLGMVGPVEVLGYRGHGRSDLLRVVGRVVEVKGVDAPEEDDSTVHNILDTFRRLESDEIPDATVRATLGDASVEGRTDHEGFFDLSLVPDSELAPGWYEVELELLDVPVDAAAGATTTAEIRVPPPDAEFAVVSDLDDTVIRTRATDLLTELRIVLTNNPSTRSLMPGAASLYRALAGGDDPDTGNPFFYVSQSGWGLYDLFERFLDGQGFPRGGLFLQDIAILEQKSPEVGHEQHKRATIRGLLDDHDDLPFVLIGDSGQTDPETYRDLVEEQPDRFRAVLIRDVTRGERDREVRRIMAGIEEMGVRAAAAESSISMARAAVDFELIPPDAIAEVRSEMVGLDAD